MFRFTIRDWSWLIVTVVVGVTVSLIPSRRENHWRPMTRRPLEQELEAINVRYKSGKSEFEFHVNRKYGTGPGWSSSEICATIERFAQAAEARDDLAARVKDLASALSFAQREASHSLDKYEADVDPASAVYRYQYTRADMEGRLRRAEQELAAAQATR